MPRSPRGDEPHGGGRVDATGQRQARYYTPQDVALHNCAEDCWVSLFGQVLDLTDLIEGNRGPLAQPLIAAAGKDISHWFSMSVSRKTTKNEAESSTPGAVQGATNDFTASSSERSEAGVMIGELRTHIDSETGLRVPYLPMGRFLHVAPNFPTTDWSTDFGLPWWRDPKRVIGKLTRKARLIRIVNVLSQLENELLVACEDTLADIQQRYLEFNAHAASYTWKVLKDENFVRADMDQTLEGNGIADDNEVFEKLGIDNVDYTPVIHIYFNDDLTIA